MFYKEHAAVVFTGLAIALLVAPLATLPAHHDDLP